MILDQKIGPDRVKRPGPVSLEIRRELPSRQAPHLWTFMELRDAISAKVRKQWGTLMKDERGRRAAMRKSGIDKQKAPTARSASGPSHRLLTSLEQEGGSQSLVKTARRPSEN